MIYFQVIVLIQLKKIQIILIYNHLTITNNEAVCQLIIKNADTLKWEIKTENNEMIEFHLTFTPNYLDILQQKINETNVLSSKLKKSQSNY